MQHILLVEDDPEITKLLNLHFNTTQYQLTSCGTGEEALRKIKAETYHLILLDISLPDSNGIEICKKLRAANIQTPVMMLTSHAEEANKVLALELGADDYITKPFSILELMARVKAIIRRSNKQVSVSEQKEIIFGDLVIDAGKRKTSVKGIRLDLTVKEFDLLWLLVSNPGKTFTRHELLQKIWGFNFKGYEHTVTSHINRLRFKLEKDVDHSTYILTTWGAGYRFRE